MSETKFKKYKNRKIYNTETSRYATLSEVYYAAMNGTITVTDVPTSKDITDETIIRGALEIFGAELVKALADAAVKLGQQNDLVQFCSKSSNVPVINKLTAVAVAAAAATEIDLSSEPMINDLFTPTTIPR